MTKIFVFGFFRYVDYLPTSPYKIINPDQKNNKKKILTAPAIVGFDALTLGKSPRLVQEKKVSMHLLVTRSQ
jgi:hypothetical protein